MIPKTYPLAQIKVWEGYDHCRMMTKDKNNYCRELEKCIQE